MLPWARGGEQKRSWREEFRRREGREDAKCGMADSFRFVVRLARNDGADAATGTRVVAVASGNQVGVAVEDALPGAGAVVDAEVESADCRIGFQQAGGEAAGEAVQRGPFVRREVAERSNVAARDDQRMSG